MVVRPFGSCYLQYANTLWILRSCQLADWFLGLAGFSRVSLVERNRESVFFLVQNLQFSKSLFYLVFSCFFISVNLSTNGQPVSGARLRCQNSQYSKGLYYAQTPGFAQAETRVNTREFCTTSNNGKDFMFNYVARVLTRTRCVASAYLNQNVLLLRII